MGERPDVTSGRSVVQSLLGMEPKSGYVYILQSVQNGTYYIGSTKNIGHRLEEHRAGVVKYTRNLRPLTLMFYQKYKTLIEAKQIEYKLKRFKNRKIIEQIITEQCIRIKPMGP